MPVSGNRQLAYNARLVVDVAELGVDQPDRGLPHFRHVDGGKGGYHLARLKHILGIAAGHARWAQLLPIQCGPAVDRAHPYPHTVALGGLGHTVSGQDAFPNASIADALLLERVVPGHPSRDSLIGHIGAHQHGWRHFERLEDGELGLCHAVTI
ncbi:hypothetical protein D3C72_1489070 [compost metagenome]